MVNDSVRTAEVLVKLKAANFICYGFSGNLPPLMSMSMFCYSFVFKANK